MQINNAFIIMGLKKEETTRSTSALLFDIIIYRVWKLVSSKHIAVALRKTKKTARECRKPKT